MTIPTSLRAVTIVAVCAVCIPAAFRGASIAHFAITEARVAGTPDSLDTVKGWRDENGVAAAARDPALLPSDHADRAALARQRDALKDYLLAKPLSPVRWLSLADTELSLGEPIESVVRAFQMSELTGPYEGYLMPRRAIIGLLIWDKLGPDERIGAARDLALADFTTPQWLTAKGILGAKSKDTRDSVRFEVLQIEGLQADRLSNLGFQ